MKDFDRLPPQNLEAEQCVLGSILLNGSVIDEVTDCINSDDLYRESHKKIFEGIKRLSEKSEPIDLITLSEELEKMGELSSVGGVDYLSDLLSMVPTAANASYYAKIVRDKAIERKLRQTCMDIINDIHDSDLTAEELVDKAESKIYEISNVDIKNDFSLISTTVTQYFDKIKKQQQEGVDSSGVKCGYIDIDDLTNGFKPGQLVVIAARPSMGKTALALNFARKSALDYDKAIAIFSLEMSKEELLGRLIGSQARVDVSKLSHSLKNIEANEWLSITEAAEKISNTKLFIDDSSAINTNEIRSKCRRIKAKYGNLDMIIIDYLQLMGSVKNTKSQNREQDIAEISRTLKGIAKELGVPIIALSQLNRDVEKRTDKRPKLSDLRESGAIEQDADMIIFLYRDEVYDQKTQDLGIAEVIVAKNRSGPTKLIRLSWIGRYTTFENLLYAHNELDEHF